MNVCVNRLKSVPIKGLKDPVDNTHYRVFYQVSPRERRYLFSSGERHLKGEPVAQGHIKTNLERARKGTLELDFGSSVLGSSPG